MITAVIFDLNGVFLNYRGVNSELLTLAQELKKKGIKLFALTNGPKEQTLYHEKEFPFFKDIFDKVYSSWETGFLKPDTRAFETILKENNLKPEEVVYFDDSEDNIYAAASLGIKAFVFENTEEARKKFI